MGSTLSATNFSNMPSIRKKIVAFRNDNEAPHTVVTSKGRAVTEPEIELASERDEIEI